VIYLPLSEFLVPDIKNDGAFISAARNVSIRNKRRERNISSINSCFTSTEIEQKNVEVTCFLKYPPNMSALIKTH
jgi:hypothetical protein